MHASAQGHRSETGSVSFTARCENCDTDCVTSTEGTITQPDGSVRSAFQNGEVFAKCESCGTFYVFNRTPWQTPRLVAELLL